SMPDARMFLYELSPITQRSASTRFDLPQPFGPTTPVSPRSMTNSAGSTKDLKPRSRSRVNFMRATPRATRQPSRSGGQAAASMMADISSTDIPPEYFLPFMKNVGVASTPNSFSPR